MMARLLRLVGILLMLTAVLLTLSRAADRPVETLVARWAPAPSDFIDLRGQIVHFRDVGPRNDPAPIVLLHGLASSLHTWEAWARALQGRRRVISFDLTGSGLTGPSISGDYTPAADVRFTLDVLEALHVGRFVIGGHGLGGEIAWRTALAAPERVDRLILVDSEGLPHASADMPLAARLARVPLLNRLAEWVLPRPLVTQALMAAYAKPESVTHELVERHFELALREGNRMAVVMRLRQREAASPEDLQMLRVPTLILWGGRDRLVPPDIGQQFHKHIAGSRLHVIDGAGHVPQEEDPAKSAAAVSEFLGGA